MQQSHGYDNAANSEEDDALERWRFALDIADTIRSTPSDWSARIGLFGSWGSGKSTIFAFLTKHLTDLGYVVVPFNPSSSENLADVMSGFGFALLEELSEQGLFVEPKPKRVLREAGWLTSKLTPSVVEGVGELHKGAKLANSILGILTQWLKPKGEQIQRLRDKLPETRVVVLVDDLDRCSRDILPKFFLALREVLDLPKFTFVLAFDDDIVSQVLSQDNPAWGSGKAFLDKIIDFRFAVPPMDLLAKQRLLASSIKDFAPFIPISSIAEVIDLIPDNPRKLKSLIRSMSALKKILERHEEGELSWTDVWLVELLRQESHVLFQKLYDEKAYEQIFGTSYHLLQRRTDPSSGSTADPADEIISDVMKDDPVSSERLRVIISAIRSRATINIRYVYELTIRVPAITWKEFHAIYRTWLDEKSADNLEQLLIRHAKTRSDSVANTYGEFFGTICLDLDGRLHSVIRTTDVKSHREAYQEIAPLYELLDVFFELDGALTTERYKALYGRIQYWAGASRPGVEAEQRAQERRILIKITKNVPREMSSSIVDVLQPWSSINLLNEDEKSFKTRIALRDEITSIVMPNVISGLCQFLGEPDSFKRIGEKDRYLAYKQIIFAEQMKPWDDQLRSRIFSLIAAAEIDEDSYNNVEGFVSLFVRAIAYRLPDVDRSGIRSLLKDSELVRALWDALCAHELMPRGRLFLLGMRERLIEGGADGDCLPLSDELIAQLPIFEEQKDLILQALN